MNDDDRWKIEIVHHVGGLGGHRGKSVDDVVETLGPYPRAEAVRQESLLVQVISPGNSTRLVRA